MRNICRKKICTFTKYSKSKYYQNCIYVEANTNDFSHPNTILGKHALKWHSVGISDSVPSKCSIIAHLMLTDEKNWYYEQKINQLINIIEQQNEKIDSMYYAPYGPGYYECKENFEKNMSKTL